MTGATVMETVEGEPFDLTYNPYLGINCIIIETVDGAIFLSRDDVVNMMQLLSDDDGDDHEA